MTTVATLKLAYIFYADAPQRLPEGTTDWFTEFPLRVSNPTTHRVPEAQTQDSCVGFRDLSEKLRKLSIYVDNTYFFSRSCRNYLFPEIVTLEDEILQTAPSVLHEHVLFRKVGTTRALSKEIAKRWWDVRHSKVVPKDRRLRRYLISRIAGVDRDSHGWSIIGSIDQESDWECKPDSVEFRLLDAEVQLYEGNVGVVLLAIGIPEDKVNSEDFLRDLSAVTKDVMPPTLELPAAQLHINDGAPIENGWLTILMEITEPFRRGSTPNSRSLFTPENQEYGQYFRRLWYLPEHEMKAAYNIVRINYLHPFPNGGDRQVPDDAFNLAEGWDGLVYHHEFIISKEPTSMDRIFEARDADWWYRGVLQGVVEMDYSWLWLLAIVQRVRLGRLLASLDVSAPANAEAELQEFYDFMQQENFAFPSTQPGGNRLAKELSKATGANELVKEIESEAAAIRESVLARLSRTQAAALVAIALLGTWISFGELAQDDGTWSLDWFKQQYTWLAFLAVIAVYGICRMWLLRKSNRHVRR